MSTSHRRSRVPVGLAVLLAGLVALLPVSPAAADDPPFVGWSAALPGIALAFDPSSADQCVAGRVGCVRATIATLQRRLDPEAAGCAHSAVFGLAYLRTTQTYLETATMDGFYQDPAFVNHEDAVFASFYYAAQDRWAAWDVSRVPPAWRIAFAAADGRQVSGTGDLLLGMNAHVNRDLPFVLASIGLVTPDGRSRKADHDKVDEMLNRVVAPLVDEEAARFDPTVRTAQTPYGVGYTGLMQALVAWRESAWREAEQLVLAPTADARAQVAATIEADAAANARAIVASTAYAPPVTTTSARDAYCAAHHDGS